MDSRPALKMADRSSLPAESYLTAAEGKQSMAMHFQSNVCTTTLPIMFKTQGSMALDPRATNYAFPCMMAQEAKCATSISNEMDTKHIKAPTSIMIGQEARDTCSMLYNLSMQAN